MRNIWTIAKKEYDHYFMSPMAYAIAFVIFLVLGIIFWIILLSFTQNAFQLYGQSPDLSAVMYWFMILLVFFLPALTMRLISDEMRMGTMELMLTAPVRDAELIIGKWLGSFLFMLTIIAVTLIYPIILNRYVDPGIDQQLMMSAYLGIILVAASFLALGVGISALFENQIAAILVTILTFLFIWVLVGFPANLIPNAAEVFRYLSMNSHFEELNQGAIHLGDLVYFVSLTVLGLFTGTAAVEMRRWR